MKAHFWEFFKFWELGGSKSLLVEFKTTKDWLEYSTSCFIHCHGVYLLIGVRTRDRWMEGADESTELSIVAPNYYPLYVVT